MGQCYQCLSWQYDDRVEAKYGEGTGLCAEDKEPKGCNRVACLLFQSVDSQTKKTHMWYAKSLGRTDI